MVLQSTGQISFSNIQTEFGGQTPISLSEYYQNVVNGQANGVVGIPNIGNQISINNFYNKSKVVSIQVNGIVVTPNIINNNTYYYAFTSTTDTYTFTCTKDTSCDVLLIGGGGGAGTGFGGGGGAGACITGIGYTLTANTYTIKVGTGGKGGLSNGNTSWGGTNGTDSSIGTLFVAKGGGGGDNPDAVTRRTANTGGCGGGGGGYLAGIGGSTATTNVVNSVTIGPITTTTYRVAGNKGGNAIQWIQNNYGTVESGGGGGIGVAGSNAVQWFPGPGGNGLHQVTINGVVYNFKNYFSPNTGFGVNDGSGKFYIGGGGAAAGIAGPKGPIKGGLGGGGDSIQNPGTRLLFNGVIGAANTGSGGGGGANANADYSKGGDGGTGLVIIRFKIIVI
jgi:hypothetical protein